MARKVRSLMINLAHLIQKTWIVFVVFASLLLVATLTNSLVSTEDNISIFARVFVLSILLYGFIILICAILRYYNENNSIMLRFFYIILVGFLGVITTGLGFQVFQYILFLSNYILMSLHVETQDINAFFTKIYYVNIDSIKKYIRQILKVKELSIVYEVLILNMFLFTFNKILECLPHESFKCIINLPDQNTIFGDEDIIIRKKDLSIGFLYKAIP